MIPIPAWTGATSVLFGLTLGKGGALCGAWAMLCGRSAFDPRRCAMLLIGGDKTGNNRVHRWY